MLRDEAGSFEAIVCPAFGFEEIPAKKPHFDAAVFTSRAGVSFAPEGKGRVAYCVGDATAQMSKNAGYDPQSANGTADELVDLILRQTPKGSLLHIRGEKSLGDVTKRLVAQGIDCSDVIAYRKVRNAPPESVAGDIRNASELVVPLFSAETVSILVDWKLGLDGCTIVAISDVVANSALGLNPSKVVVSDSPDMRGMAAATARLSA
ncbi:uroporphyrinogen-III synthase [Octadecabacter ascidiaceicola]|uniref:Uroporphyrinogen-III synthase n=1 Tax=Octadecabacter ascidiaceicola TaxID=1655543 RepID=A0A238KEA5_9RHOB|nr:uroporphyrinogen-III synthase [Octadecabacter ascidiaceicola]SMX41129.1 uroporphyrinogen-III synthase [Octadecabacter ascidiaceicola]